MTESLVVRPASMADEDMLLAWRNDQATIEASLGDGPVDDRQHHTWLEESLRSDLRVLFIGMVDEIPVGTVRFDSIEDRRWEVSVTVAPAWRGRGFGPQLLRVAIDRLLGTRDDVDLLVAKVQPGNEASVRLFARLGFEVHEDGSPMVFTRDARLDDADESSAM